uniref:Mut7-C RNAse domain-containing protein n=1 Tax=candidate division WOR-3 bacterium TaxID=2052148 RepID=A0A7C4XES9_UNCW3
MKFLCDGMLGKLCKYLRICGIDTIYCNEGMKILLLAKREDRIVLTKNTQLKNKNGFFFVEGNDPIIQLKTVLEKFDLAEKINPFSRCLCCNEVLIPVEKEKIKGRIPYYTYKNFDDFAECPKCQRVYWKGSHYRKMEKNIKRWLNL